MKLNNVTLYNYYHAEKVGLYTFC